MRAAAQPGSELRQLIDNAILAELGARVLWWQGVGDTVFFSKGRDYADPNQLKDQRIGLPGKSLEELVLRCGGKAAGYSVEKLYDWIKDGTADGAMIGFSSVQNFRLGEVADTITFTAHSPIEFILTINEKRWQSLSPAHRDVIAEAARKVERELRDRLPAAGAKYMDFALAKGMKVLQLTPDQVADWRACSAEMLGNYMEKNGELAHQLMVAYAKLRADPCCTASPSTAEFTRR